MIAEVLVQPLEVGGRVIATDHLGYLLDPADWDIELTEVIAARQGLTLGEEHLTLVALVRDYYDLRQTVPAAHALFKGMREAFGEARATRRHLHVLFPYDYGSQISKIAGMTMPRKVMLDV